MKKIVKQVVGIDVAQKELVVSVGRMLEDFSTEFYAHKRFLNSEKGFEALVVWAGNLSDAGTELRYVMEATGVYHEGLAYFLAEKGYALSVVLPNKIASYVRTLQVRTITDKTAAQAIAQFGLERRMQQWKQPSKIYQSLRQLNREREQVVQERTMVKNHLHAEGAQAAPNKGSVERIQKRIAFLNEQEKQIKAEIAALVSQHGEVQAKVGLLCSIPGIGARTATVVLCETNGFELIANKKQLASYAGLDVKEKQSGTSVRGKARITKRGNKYLRKAMHLPALAAIRHEERFKTVFTRLLCRHGIKMKAVVAIQRKLLELTYVIYKTGQPYNQNYLNVKTATCQPSVPIKN